MLPRMPSDERGEYDGLRSCGPQVGGLPTKPGQTLPIIAHQALRTAGPPLVVAQSFGGSFNSAHRAHD